MHHVKLGKDCDIFYIVNWVAIIHKEKVENGEEYDEVSESDEEISSTSNSNEHSNNN